MGGNQSEHKLIAKMHPDAIMITEQMLIVMNTGSLFVHTYVTVIPPLNHFTHTSGAAIGVN